ncbi:glycine zipper domain-containing protein [Brevifollis gellanilyticus]|nr:glycine zipper domain-containing protein [Brevifollis gellanilyticus]
MKHAQLGMMSLIAAASLASCATGPNAQTGTVIGALGGAAAGGIIGNQSGRGLEGAAIGAGLGALAGNAIGNSSDQRNYYYNSGYRPNGYYRSSYYAPPPRYYAPPPPYYGY